MQSDALHATPAVLCLGVGIVIGVRVDVVGVGPTLCVLDELDSGNTDIVRSQEGLPGRDEWVLEAWQNLELVAWRDGRTGLACLLDLAGIGRAKLKALRRVDPDGVDEPSANELDARDERLGRLDVTLNEHDPIDGFLKGFAREMLLESDLRVDQFDAKALAGAVVFEDDRIADGRGSTGNVFATNRGNGGRGFDAESGQSLILGNLGDFELKRTLAVDDGAPMLRKPREHRRCVFGRVAMSTRVRGGTHTVVEDPRRWHRCEIYQTA